MMLKNCAILTFLILFCCEMRTARASELGNLNDRVYLKLCAAHNIEGIENLLGIRSKRLNWHLDLSVLTVME